MVASVFEWTEVGERERERERREKEERERERERDNRLHSPFALHAPIHWAMLGGCDQEQGVVKSGHRRAGGWWRSQGGRPQTDPRQLLEWTEVCRGLVMLS